MSNYYGGIPRQRARTLLIVEGKKEKGELFYDLFRLFPELKIEQEDVLVYGSNIYKLHRAIVREYGADWDTQEIDLLVCLRDIDGNNYHTRDFKNIFLVFDLEPHAPDFDASVIQQLQSHFHDATNEGMLYVNYPMVEAYLDFKTIPDKEYLSRSISVDEIKAVENCALGYKNTVNKCSIVKPALSIPEILSERIRKIIKGQIEQLEFLNWILNTEFSKLSSIEMIRNALLMYLDGKDIEKKKNFLTELYGLAAQIHKEQIKPLPGTTFQNRIKQIYQQIALHCLCKAAVIQAQRTLESVQAFNIDRDIFPIDYSAILQNQLTILHQSNIISILNTSILLLPEYNLNLLFGSDVIH